MTFLETLRALDKAATPGPWDAPIATGSAFNEPYMTVTHDDGMRHVTVAKIPGSDTNVLPDAALIVALRNSAPALAAVIEAAGVVLSDALGVASDAPQSIVSDDALGALRTALAALDKGAK